MGVARPLSYIRLIVMHDAPPGSSNRMGEPGGGGSSWFVVLMAVILTGHFDNGN